ncbi:MAG: hypothetical protein ACYTFD_20250 [Planctomycetota bacterium]|jgi:hypothetical protein
MSKGKAKRRKCTTLQRVGLFVLTPDKEKIEECPLCDRPIGLRSWTGGAGRGRVKLRMIERTQDGAVGLSLERVNHYGPGSGLRRSIEAARRSLLSILRKERAGLVRELERQELLIDLLESPPRRAAR